MIICYEFHRNQLTILVKRKTYNWHGAENGTDQRRDGQGINNACGAA